MAKVIKGLPNIGNSCYFNAFIQICNPLIDDLIKNNINRVEQSTNNLLNVVYLFYNKYFMTDNIMDEYINMYKALNIKKNFSFKTQQDSSEMILLITDLLKDNKLTKSLVSVEFNQVIQCNNCLSYKICAKQIESMLISNTLMTSNNSVITFKEFLGNSLLKNNFIPAPSDEFKCKCNEKTPTIRTVLISLPTYLYINVGRYDNNLRKIKKTLEIPDNLTITTPINIDDILSKKNNDKINNTYQLTGIVVHIGSVLNSGHYVAYIKKDTDWYYCDDLTVSKCDIQNKIDLIKQNCTVLLYKKI